MDLLTKIILGIALVLLVWLLFCNKYEGFSKDGIEFVPLGSKRYGLRGDLLKQIDIKKFYINPDRQIRLSNSNGEMWESNNTPSYEGFTGCVKVKCPKVGYNHLDNCWKCPKKR